MEFENQSQQSEVSIYDETLSNAYDETDEHANDDNYYLDFHTGEYGAFTWTDRHGEFHMTPHYWFETIDDLDNIDDFVHEEDDIYIRCDKSDAMKSHPNNKEYLERIYGQDFTLIPYYNMYIGSCKYDFGVDCKLYYDNDKFVIITYVDIDHPGYDDYAVDKIIKVQLNEFNKDNIIKLLHTIALQYSDDLLQKNKETLAKQTTYAIHEELIKITCHPDRIRDWVYDEDEKLEFKELYAF